ncbi:rna-directed dna polymerase from mobile element jockey-like protein, partial [Dinothrombium tinctorium]
RNDRTFKCGGGIVIYVRNDRNFSYENLLITNEIFEMVTIKILQPKSKPLLVSCVYKPPDMNKNEFYTRFAQLFEDFPNFEHIVVGDFNINILKNENRKWVTLYSHLGLNQVIKKPTHFGFNGASLIDHILVNKLGNIVNCGVVDMDISDHSMTYIVRKVNARIKACKNMKSIQYRNLKYISDESIASLYQNIDTSRYYSHENFTATKMYNCLMNDIKYIFDTLAPIKQKRINVNNPNNWITREIFSLIREKHHNLKIIKHRIKCSIDCQDLIDQYKEIKNKLNYICKKAKRDYYMYNIEQRKNDSYAMWKFLRHLLSNQTEKKASTINAYEANEFFVNATKKLTNNHFGQLGVLHFDPCLYDAHHQSLIDLSDINIENLRKTVTNLKRNKALADENINVAMFQMVFPLFEPHIHSLINLMLRQGLPQDLKTSKVIPVYKNQGSKSNPESYRPISLTHIFSKIVEKHVADMIRDFLEINNLLFKNQFGF